MTKRLRIAMIGAGDVAQRDYLPELHRLTHLGHLALICVRDPRLAQPVADRYDVPRVSDRLEDALAPDIDAIVNLTPVSAHGAINLALACAGKPFFSEKTLAATLAEAQAVVDAAGSDLPIAAAPSVMLYPQVQAVAKLLGLGTIGALRAVRASVSTSPPPWPGYLGDLAPYFAKGIGPLTDLGVYALHAILGLFGPVAAVAAVSHRTRHRFVPTEGPFAGQEVQVEEDDDWHLLLRLADGPTATLHASFAADLPQFGQMEISGETGTVVLSLLDPGQPVTLWRGGVPESVPVAHARTDGPDHVLGVEDLLLALRDGRAPRLSAQTALDALALREAAGRAARTGTWEVLR